MMAIPYTQPKGAGTSDDRNIISFKVVDSLALSQHTLMKDKTGLDIIEREIFYV
ncbi:hypothetical protein SAMN05444008_10552 [Cnuella takakiae]|uniref:Uncharacterized protein n=1 Tax=Cnuella takakiae TaxID=1302690 RepID=A0A1M4Z1A6_9BACT|nr:hypothetical protein SAMN05444008_10552 [Cnuella takakiae]